MTFVKALIIVTFLSLLFGQFGKIPFFPENYNVYLLDLFVLSLILMINFYLLISGGIKKAFIDPIVFFGGIFVFWSLLAFIFNLQWWGWQNSLLGFSYWLRFVIYFLVYFSLRQIRELGSPKFHQWVVYVLVWTGLALAVIGLLQMIMLPDLSDLARFQGYDPHKNRVVSSFLDPNFTGAFLVLTLNLVLSRFRFKETKDYIVVFLLLIALILTFSRSAWVMLAVSLLLLGVLRSRSFILVAFLVAFLAYFLVPRVQTRLSGITDPDDSAKLRLVSWQRTLSVAKNNLFFGVGFNNFRLAQEEYGFFDYTSPQGGHAGGGSDSSLLLVLATVGIPGLIFYLFFYLAMLLGSLKWTINGNKTALASFISLIGLLFESNFINSLFFTPILLWIFTVLALLPKYEEEGNASG